MKGVPLTTTILVVLLVIVSVRFAFVLSQRCSSSNKVEVIPQEKIAAEEILSCQDNTEQIKTCTSETITCLDGIENSKKFHEENQQKISACQSENEKNLELNKELKAKLDSVTEILEVLISSKQASTQQTQGSQL